MCDIYIKYIYDLPQVILIFLSKIKKHIARFLLWRHICFTLNHYTVFEINYITLYYNNISKPLLTVVYKKCKYFLYTFYFYLHLHRD